MSQDRQRTNSLDTYEIVQPGKWLSFDFDLYKDSSLPTTNEIYLKNQFYFVMAADTHSFMSELHLMGEDCIYYTFNFSQFLFKYYENDNPFYINLKNLPFVEWVYLKDHSYEDIVATFGVEKMSATFKASCLYLQHPNSYVNKFSDIKKFNKSNSGVVNYYKRLYTQGATIGLFANLLPDEISELISSFSDYNRSYKNIGLVCRETARIAGEKCTRLSPVKLLPREQNRYIGEIFSTFTQKAYSKKNYKDKKKSYKESEKHSRKKIQGMKRRKMQKENTYTISLPYTITGNGCRNAS